MVALRRAMVRAFIVVAMGLSLGAATLGLSGQARAASPKAAASPAAQDLAFASLDGLQIKGTFYRAAGKTPTAVLVAVHGGGWNKGDSSFYKEWGPYLAKHGIALFAIDYRLATSSTSTWPGAAYDVLAAVAHLRRNAASFGIDPDRIGLIGDSAGAHLAAIAALDRDGLLAQAGVAVKPDDPANEYRVKTVVGVYGVYDLVAQWQHDNATRPTTSRISQMLIGPSALENRMAYIKASPISYADSKRRRVSFMVVYGTADEVVDPQSQSRSFAAAMLMAGSFVRPLVVTGAGHYWIVESPETPGTWSNFMAPRLLEFLHDAL